MFKIRRLLVLVALVILAVLLLGCGGNRTYTVQSGDTLQVIAARNNTTITTLIQLNKERYPSLLTNPRMIQPGWELQLPSETDVSLEIESLLMRIARSANPPTTPAPAVAAAPNAKINLVVEQIYAGINQARADHQLAPLTEDANLMSIAQTRSNDMIERDYFSHTDPQTGQVLFQVLLNQQHYTYLFAGENIAEIRNQGAFVPAGLTVYARYSADDLASQFVTGWLNSPDHYANIVNPHFRRTGIAVGVSMDGTRVVATQVFSD
jgi:uncharacterized protein YkwD